MGSLKLPTTGTVYVDTPVFIYTVERHPRYEPLLRPLWQAVQAQTVEAISSDLALLETSVRPLRQGDAALLAASERLLLHTPQIRLLPLTGYSAQCGLGSQSCGPGILPEYLLPPKPAQLSVVLTPCKLQNS